MNRTVKSRLPLRLAIALASVSLGACTVTPTPTSLNEQVEQATADRISMFADQEPISHPITLEEAMARAVKYNLRQRLALMEQALAANLVEEKSLSMLPNLAASAGWNGRDTQSASSSESILTGSESLEPSTSQDRDIREANLELSWNVLDFGLSYFGAKAQANDALALQEKRRSIIADIIQQVRSAYWDAVAAQRLQPQVKATLADARAALENARATEQQRLVSPLTSLEYQKDLLKMVRQLEAVDAELASAKSKLAALMNLPPQADYQIAMPAANELSVPTMTFKLDDLEEIAMVKRPEIREQAYAARNAVLETRSAMLRMMPGASLFVGGNYNSNSYLVDDSWADAGVKVSWNLFNVLNLPKIKRSGESRAEVAELRRQALRMSVLTQVHLAWLQYQRAGTLFERSAELSDVQDRILEQTENAMRSSAGTQLEQIRTRTETLLASRMRDRTYADLQTAFGAIYQAAGLDPLPDQLSGDSIAQLTQAIGDKQRSLAQGALSLQLPRNLGVPAKAQVAMVDVNTPPQVSLWELGSLQSVTVSSLNQD